MPPAIPNNTRSDTNTALWSTTTAEPCLALHPCQTMPTTCPAPQTMAFKNEVVSVSDIDRYNLPFQKGDGRWWTRDAERDYYLWGGISGNLAYDTVQEGWFYLYVEKKVFTFLLLPGKFSTSMKTTPYMVRWDRIIRIIPEPDSAQQEKQLVVILKEALTVYGLHGEFKAWPIETQVQFKF